MSANDLKKHTAKVGSGSGCVFQPMDDKSTYILTAKHLFQNKNDETGEPEFIVDGSEVPITFLEFDGNSWNSILETFTLEFQENFFPHTEADAAILKIPYREGFESIHIREKRLSDEYYLCGFPGRLQHQDGEGNNYANFTVESFKHSGNYFEVAKLKDNILTLFL